MAISWGIKERVRFEAGGPLGQWRPSGLSAVYAFTYKRDPHNKPKAHTVLYFGESADMSQETNVMSDVLEQLANGHIEASDLFVFIHPMPGSTRFERSEITRRLIADYRPPCNGY